MTSMDHRLQRLEDRAAIEETVYRYLSAADRGDTVALRAEFSTGPLDLIYGPMGRIPDIDALVELLGNLGPREGELTDGMLTMHHAVHPYITFTGEDEAHGTWSLRYRHVTLGDRREQVMSGAYDMTFVREDGRWRIRRNHFSILWSREQALPEAAQVALGPLYGESLSPVVADEPTDVATRLARLEARREIEELKHRYWVACDGKDPQAFRDCFVSEGADLDYGALGAFETVDQLVDIFDRIARGRDGDGNLTIFDMHHGVHPRVTVLSDTEAVGSWTLRFRQIHVPSGTERVLCGEYDDRYVVEDGAWKLQRHHFRVLWSLQRPCSDAEVIAGPLLEEA